MIFPVVSVEALKVNDARTKHGQACQHRCRHHRRECEGHHRPVSMDAGSMDPMNVEVILDSTGEEDHTCTNVVAKYKV